MDTCGTRIMELLEQCGIDVVFGIPGVHTVELYRGIAKAGIRHITARHEQGAGFMADGYARATGKVGACCLITGPGMTNAATALAQSYSDSIAVLAVSSVNKTSSLGAGQGDLHELRNQQRLAEQFTAFSRTVAAVDDVEPVVAEAFGVFDSARPRPVHVQLPIDVLNRPAPHRFVRPPRRLAPEPDQGDIAQAARLLAGARNPAAVFGGGSIGAFVQARELIDMLKIPAVLTFAAKGVIPEADPYCIGSNLLHPPVLDFLEEADIVLAVGSEFSETDIWSRGGNIRFNGTLIRIDIDAGQADMNAAADLALIGDARRSLEMLLKELQRLPDPYPWSAQRSRETVRTLRRKCMDHDYPHTQRHRVVWNAIRETLPDHGIVTADSTQLTYSGNFCYQASEPRTYLTSTTGYGTLGYALPAAIGAKVGRPGSPVVCVAGDGGFQFSIQELATAAELGLPIVAVVWNNSAFGEIRDEFDSQGIERIGVNLPSPDFVAVAKGYGCDAMRISGLNQFKSALAKGYEAKRPTVLELCADSDLESL